MGQFCAMQEMHFFTPSRTKKGGWSLLSLVAVGPEGFQFWLSLRQTWLLGEGKSQKAFKDADKGPELDPRLSGGRELLEGFLKYM